MNKLFAHQPIIALAPMADYTDEPFSLICKEFGADLIFREMVSSEALVRGNKKTLQMARISKGERPTILQIFGASPSVMAEAAKILEKECKPDGIDINMGCPVRKIVGVGAGCELMRSPETAAEIVRAVKSAIKVPVSVKMRLGWKKREEILKFAPIIEKAGADFITVHGRTRDEQYSGDADWEVIARVKSALKIPVIANGSIWTADDAEKCLKITGADGVAIARGALGNPWIFKEIKDGIIKKDQKEIRRVIFRHLDLHLWHYREKGIVTFRKHLGFYFKGVPGAKDLRVKLVRVESKKELENILNQL
jgi:tRNA-dihydrouridine synthase B